MKVINVNIEYEKFPELKDSKEEVLKIWKWVKQQPHLPDLDEREVIVFYYVCQYHTEITKQTIDLHYTTKTHCPEFFSNLDPLNAELRQAMRTVSLVHLQQKTPQGYKVVFAKLSDFDTTKFNFADILKLVCMCFELILIEEGTASGFEVGIDLAGATLGHLARVGFMNLKKFLFFIQEAQAIRIAGIHFLNLVPFMDQILAMLKPLLKEELAKILQLHSSYDSFYKFVPKEILPVDYGGNEESVEILSEKFYKNLTDNREYFLKEEVTRRVNEKLRAGKPKNASDLFGMEGNFKQLIID